MERRLEPGADVEALADDVMMTILDPEFLRTRSREKGRFRDLLLAVSRRKMANYRRYRDAERRERGREVGLDVVGELGPASDEERIDFDRFYAREVFEAALEAFRKESEERESPEARIVDLYYRGGLTQEEIAQRVGLTLAATNTHLDRGRKRLRKHFLTVLAILSRRRRGGRA